MDTERDIRREGERGSAMVIAVLVMAILTLLGVSFLLMADTENKIAENEKLSAQALYFGEGVTREVKRWFDRPPYSTIGDRNLVRPTTAVMRRDLRVIDIDGAGPTVGFAADGSPGAPYYKVGIDRDVDGNDDIFDKPYRSALADMLVGTAINPDIRMDRTANSATATFLDALAEKVMPNFPNGAAGVRARIKRIDVYAPPYIDTGGGNWQRFGMATVSTRVQILRNPGTAGQVVMADRVVSAVLNETPFPGPFGPFHSCDEINFNGEFRLHWGASTAVAAVNPPGSLGNNNKMDLSIPRAIPPSVKADLIYGYNDNTIFNTLKTNLEAGAGKVIDDPWYQFFAGGPVNTWGGLGSPQPWAPIDTDQDKSNRFQNFPGVGCPSFDYGTFKSIAQSGGSDVHYYAWDNGTQFRQNGVGAATDFLDLVNGKTGLFFFDTTDGIAPHDFDATLVASNLTPQIDIGAGAYGMRGFLYVNTENFSVSGSPGRPITITMPGEPFQDTNLNGVKDAGEAYINLNYNSIADLDDEIRGSATDDFGNGGGGPIWNAKGKTLPGTFDALLWGVLYVSGQFDAQGNAIYYGSVVTYAGTTAPTSSGTPDFYWDPSIKDTWPPLGWELPRVIITRWQTDL